MTYDDHEQFEQDLLFEVLQGWEEIRSHLNARTSSVFARDQPAWRVPRHRDRRRMLPSSRQTNRNAQDRYLVGLVLRPAPRPAYGCKHRPYEHGGKLVRLAVSDFVHPIRWRTSSRSGDIAKLSGTRRRLASDIFVACGCDPRRPLRVGRDDGTRGGRRLLVRRSVGPSAVGPRSWRVRGLHRTRPVDDQAGPRLVRGSLACSDTRPGVVGGGLAIEGSPVIASRDTAKPSGIRVVLSLGSERV